MHSDDLRAGLEELRDQLKRAMKRAPVAVKAQTAAQLRATLKDLADVAGSDRGGLQVR